MEPTLNTLSPSEIEIMRKIKQSGGTLEDAQRALVANSQGRQSPLLSQTSTPTTQPEEKGFIADILGDIAGGVTSTIKTFDERSDTVAESMRDTYVPFLNPEGKQSPHETALQIASQGVLAVGDTAFNVVLAGAKALMPEKTEQEIAQGLGGVIEEVAKEPAVQELAGWFQGLSQRTQRNLSIPMALIEVATLQGGSSLFRKAVREGAEEAVGGTLTATRKVGTEVAEQTAKRVTIGDRVRNLLPTKLRYQLSDIPENYANAIKRSDEATIKEYARVAEEATKETGANTPLEIVGKKAEDAYSKISTKMEEAGKAKREALAKIGNEKVGNNPAGTTIDELQKSVGERFGVTIDVDGTVRQVEGRMSTLSNPDINLLSEYTQKLRQLGINPTVQQVDDFVDWAQRQLYKQSASYSQLESADKPLIALLKEKTGVINRKLKESDVVKGTDYAKANDDFSRLIPMQDELSRGLGAEGRKGGAFVKRVFSPSDARTKELFAEIYQETGINLTDEATLAKFFMESTGDARQASLLRQFVDVAEGTNQIDLMKPQTWLNYLRENADMDGEELALEILRQAKRAEDAGELPRGTTQAMEETARQKGFSVGADVYRGEIPPEPPRFVVPDATKEKIPDLIDYLRLNQKYSKQMEADLQEIMLEHNINPDLPNGKIANKLEELLENTDYVDEIKTPKVKVPETNSRKSSYSTDTLFGRLFFGTKAEKAEWTRLKNSSKEFDNVEDFVKANKDNEFFSEEAIESAYYDAKPAERFGEQLSDRLENSWLLNKIKEQ